MDINIFSSFVITLPDRFQEKIKSYVKTAGKNSSRENSVFERQVDFWYMAMCIAFHEGQSPIKETDTYQARSAEILSRDPFRIHQMQLIALSISKDENILTKPKEMFEICSGLANAGVPKLLTILSDTDQSPMWNLLDELEETLK